MTLDTLPIGGCAQVEAISIEETMRRRLQDMGLIVGTTVTCVGKAPAGDPIALAIRGAVVALRVKDCRKITVRRI